MTVRGTCNFHRHPSRAGAVRRIALSGLFAAGLLFAGCEPAKPGAESDDPVAIEIGGETFRLSELQAQVAFLEQSGSAAVRDRDTFVQTFIERRVAIQRAKELGLDQDIELQRQWENLLIGRLHQAEVEAKLKAVEVTDDEVQDYYNRNQASYTRPEQARLALLFLKCSEKHSKEQRCEVRERLEEARELATELPSETRGFGALAIHYSEESTSRFKGGDVGWYQAGEARYRWPDAVMAAAFALTEIGEISPVIEAPDGYYLIKKLDGRDASTRPLDDTLRASLRARLLREKRDAVAGELANAWRSEVTTVVHNEVLTGLEFPSAIPEPVQTADVHSGLP